MLFKSSIIVAILATCAFAVPTGHRSSCSVECLSSDKFSYKIGKTYEYKYSAETRTGNGNSINEVDDTEPGIRVEATIQIHPISPCEYILTLSDVSTDASSNSNEFSSELTKNSVKFSLQDGKVESVCPSANEPIWVLNFKKGILSTFQHSMKTHLTSEVVTETDISGECETVYDAVRHDNEVITTKTKALSKCTKKPHTSSQMASFGFNLDTFVDGITPITSEQTCTHLISEDIVKKATCQEVHTFQPFSHQDAGKVYTSATTTLYFMRIVSGPQTYSDVFDIKTELTYDLTDLEKLEDLISAEDILSKLDSASEDGIKKEVPVLFSELVSNMKKLSYSQLMELVTVTDNNRVIKFVYDALPLVGTVASNECIVDLIRDNKYSKVDTAVFYTSLAFIKNPSEDMFLPVMKLFKHEQKLHQELMLGISSMVYNYCESNEDCTSVEVIEEIITHLESFLGTSCRSTTEEDKNVVLVALKSLGNIGRQINGNTILSRCFMENNPTEVRIAAIEAWRRTPCSISRNHLLSMYEDSSYDSELRIAAYLQAMKCPSQIMVDTIKSRLTSEGINQVSSFVWSHLNNIQESAAQNKQMIRELIGEQFLKDKFTTDVMKFSRYFESSVHSNALNVGGSIDSDVIFSSESFIPRSAMLNLTVNMFGKAINFFEVGGRIEGYEHFIEKFFGPNGYYPDETIQQVINNLRDDKFEKSPELSKLIGHSSSDPKGSMYARFLGNELFYTSHLGSDDILSQLGFTSPMDLIIEMFTKGNIDYMKSYNIVKSKFIVPTVTGFPLHVSFDGSATVGFVLDGDFNFDNLNTFELQGKIQPSAALSIDSTMMVDAFLTKTGRKFTTTLHSSTVAQGKAVVNGLKLVDFSVHIPNEDMTVYEYTYNSIRLDDGEEHNEAIDSKVETNCYPNGGALGMQLCTEVKTTTNDQFLSKNLILKKMDTHTSYDFHFIRDDGKFSVMFDMPNSKESNRHKLSYYFDGTIYEAKVHHPQMYKTIKGVVDTNGMNKMLSMHVLDGPNEDESYAAELKIENTITRTGIIIRPTMKLSVRGEDTTNIEGVITNEIARKIFEIQATSLSTHRLSIVPSGNLEFVWKYGENSGDLDMKFSTYSSTMPEEKDIIVELSGSGEISKDSIAFILDGHYQKKYEKKTHIHVSTDLKKETSVDGIVYKVNANIPYINLNTETELSFLKHNYGLMSTVKLQDYHWKLDTYYKSKENFGEKFAAGKIWLDVHHSESSYGIENSFSLNKDRIHMTGKGVNGNNLSTINAQFMYEYGRRMQSSLSMPYISVNMDIVNKEQGKIYLQSSMKCSAMTGDIKGVLENQSTKNKLDFSLNVDITKNSTVSHSSTYTTQAYLATDGNSFNFDLGVKKIKKGSTFYKLYDIDNLVQITANATPSSFYFSSNIVQPFTIDVKFITEGTHRIESVAHYGDYVVEIMSDFSPNQVLGSFKTKDEMINFSGQLVGNGLETFIMWAPDKKIDVMVKYDNSQKSSLLISVQTPFSQWRKQEVRVTHLLDYDHLDTSVNMIWRNSEHFNFNSKLNWNLSSALNNEVSGTISLTSTIPGFERINFNIEHTSLNDYDGNTIIKTNVQGNSGYSDNAIKISLNVNEEQKQIILQLISPVTEPFNMKLQGTKENTVGTVSLGFTYGVHTSLFTLTYHDMPKQHLFKFKADSPHTPVIDFTADIDRESQIMTTTLEVNKKNILYAKISIKSEDNEMHLKVTGKTIHPVNGYPVSINSGLLVNNGGMAEFDFDMSPLRSREVDRIKVHAKTNILNMTPHNVYIVGHYSGYGTKASVAITHEINLVSNTVNNEISIGVNSFTLNTFLEAYIDTNLLTGSLSTTVKSSLQEINGMAFTAKHELNDNTRNTLIRYTNGDNRIKIYNSVEYSDELNWKNVLIVDDYLKTMNKMSSIRDHHFTHEIEWTIGENELVSKFDIYPNGEFKTKASLNTSYAPSFQVQATNEFIGEKGVFKGMMIYAEGETINTATEYMIVDHYIHLKHETVSDLSSWLPFEIEFDMRMESEKTAKVSANAGNKFGVSVTLFEKSNTYGSKLTFEDKQTGQETSLEGKYFFSGNEKQIYIEGKLNEKLYSADIEYSILKDEISMSSHFKIPCLAIETIKTSGKYNFNTSSMAAELIHGEDVYEIEGKLDTNSIVAHINKPSGQLSILGKWALANNNGQINININGKGRNTEIGFNYSKAYATEGSFHVVYNGDQYKVKGIVEGTSASFVLTTPEDTYKMISSLKISQEIEISITVSKNSEDIHVNGKLRFDEDEGLFSISFVTPSNKGNEDYISFMYNLKESKEIKMEGKLAEKYLIARFLQIPSHSTKSQKIVFEVKLPIQNFEEISIICQNENSSSTKSSDIIVHVMGRELCSAKFLINNSAIEFGFDYKDIKLNGSIKEYTLTNGIDVVIKFNAGNTPMSMTFNYDTEQKKFNGALQKGDFTAKIAGSSKLSSAVSDLSFLVKTFKNDNVVNEYSAMFSFGMSDQIELQCAFNYNGVNYYCKYGSSISMNDGFIKIDLKTPFGMFDEFSVEVLYNKNTQEKMGKFIMNFNKVKHVFFANLQNTGNAFSLNVETPFEMFRYFKVEGVNNYNEGVYKIRGELNKDETLTIEGQVTPTGTGYIMRATIPQSIGKSTIKGEISSKSVSLSITDQYEEEQFVTAKYDIESYKIRIEVESSFPELKKFIIDSQISYKGYEYSAALIIQKDDHIFNTEVKTKLHPSDYYAKLYIKEGDAEFCNFGFGLNTKTVEKSLFFFVESEQFHHFFNGQMSIENRNENYIAVVSAKSSIKELETLRININLKVNSENLENSCQFIYNNYEYSLAFKATKKQMCYDISAVLEDGTYRNNMLSFNAYLDTKNTKAQSSLTIGEKTFYIEMEFSNESSSKQLKFKLNSPYEEYNHIYLNILYNLTGYRNTIEVNVQHNTPIIEFKAVLSTVTTNPEIHFKFNSLYTDSVEMRAHLNIENTTDLIDIILVLPGIDEYHFSFGYAANMQRFAIIVSLMCPDHVLGHTYDFNFAIDFHYGESKNALSLYLENNGEVQINVNAVYVDEESSVSLHIPNDIFGNLKTSGSYNRETRSVEMQMMNDEYTGGIVANFHSLKIDLQTPFDRLKKVSYSLTKDMNGWWVLNYKRNEHYLDYEIGRTKKGIELKLNLALPAWEVLALTGRLTEQEIEEHLMGKLPETQFTIVAGGVCGRKKGDIQWEMNSPDFPNIKKATAKFNYNVRKGTYTFHAKSPTNKDFKVFLEFKRGGLFIDVFVPHKVTPTIAKGQLTIFKGNLEISSRFPAIKTYKLNYLVEIKKTINVKSTVERNGVRVFFFEFQKGPVESHVQINIKRAGNDFSCHYHRKGWDYLELEVIRNSKRFSLFLKGSGNLPEKGKITFSIKNSFRHTPRTITGSINIDRTGSPKRIVLIIERSPSDICTVTAKYNIDLKNIRTGDINLKIEHSTPGKPSPNINIEWEFDPSKNGHITYNYDGIETKLVGKLSLRESDFVISTTKSGIANRVYGWKFIKDGNYRDYMVKFGPQSSYTFVAISGTATNIRNVDMKGTIKSRFAKNELEFTAKWSGNKQTGISGDGTFKMGNKKGAFKLHNLKRDPVRRAAKFKLTGTSNINGFSSYSIIGRYDLTERLIDVKFKWDTDELSLYTKIDNFTAKKSENSATFNIPGIGKSEITFGHDFTNPLDKVVKINGHLGGKKFHYLEHWTRNAEFTVFNLDVDIKSNFLGVIKLTAEYDVRDINNAHGNIVYSRDGKNNINVDWYRKKTANSIVNEIIVDSKARLVPSSKAYFKANWEPNKLFASSIGVEWKNKKIEAVLNIDQKMAKFYTKTPFPNVDDITAILKYDMQKKVKTITFNYERGTRKVNFSFVLNYKAKNKGTLDISLTTPFMVIKKVMLNAKWNKGKFDAHYQRNDKIIDIAGKANIKQGKSSFDVVFTPKSGKSVQVKLKYDLVDFVKRTSKKEQQIIQLEIVTDNHNVFLNIDGYRSNEKLILNTEGTSSVDFLKTFRIRLDSELNLQNREGLLDIKINDFEYKMKNKFEKFANGFYFRTQIHSTLTRLPGLTLGYGKDGSARTVTLGYGDEREISISVNGKDEFKKGLSGKIDIPRKGIMGVEYDITYDFLNDDKLNIKAELILKNGKKINYELNYHSDGVKARIGGPIETIRRLRSKRSINDFDMDDYSVTFQSGIGQNILNKGIFIEGQIFGKPFSVDTYANLKEANNYQGKLIIQTPFEGYKKLGGHFAIKQEGSTARGSGELYFNGHASTEFEVDFKDVREKILTGTVTYTPSNELTPMYFKIVGNLNKDQSVINVVSIHTSQTGDHNISVKMDHKIGEQHISVSYNNYKFDAEYVLRASPVYFKLHSEIHSDNEVIHKGDIMITIDQSEFLFSTDMTAFKGIFNIKIDMKFSQEYHYSEIEYNHINGNSMKLIYKNSEDRKQFTLKCHEDTLHVINIYVKTSDNCQVIFRVSTYLLPEIYLSSDFGKDFKTFAKISSSYGMFSTDIMATKDEGILFKKKTILHSKYGTQMVILDVLDNHNGHSEIHGQYTLNNEHVFNGKLVVNTKSVKAYLEISRLLSTINKSFIDLRASWENSAKLSLSSSLNGVAHSIEFEADEQRKVLALNVISPAVPTGQGKIHIKLEGYSVSKSEIELLLSNAETTYYGKILTKLDSTHETVMEVDLRTPIVGFEEIRFGAGYKMGSLKEAYIYAHPFNYDGKLFMGNTLNTYKIGFELVPGADMLSISAEAVIPFNSMSPHIFARFGEVQYDVDMVYNITKDETEVQAIFTHNGQSNGGKLRYTKNFPFEIEYEMQVKSEPTVNFHVMVDSSIVSLANAVYYIL